MGGGVFSHDIANKGRFGLALVSDDIDPNMDKHMKSDEELENIYVTFLAMGFLKTTIVVSGDDGFVRHKSITFKSFIFGKMRELLEGFLLTKEPFLQLILIRKLD